MITIIEADKYSHCSSCGKANAYSNINTYTLNAAKIYNVKFSIDSSNNIYSFGLCKECLKELRKKMKPII